MSEKPWTKEQVDAFLIKEMAKIDRENKERERREKEESERLAKKFAVE